MERAQEPLTDCSLGLAHELADLGDGPVWAVVDDLLRQIDRMNEQMSQNRIEIERMRSESSAIRADTDRVLAQPDPSVSGVATSFNDSQKRKRR